MTLLQKQLEDICRRFQVASLYVFGSRAKEVAAWVFRAEAPSTKGGSDLDMGVHPAPGALRDPGERVRLTQALEDLFGVARVDLVLLPRAGTFLAADIVRGELLYCDNEDRQAEEELYYLRRAGDLAPLERWRIEAVLSGEIHR
jgi:predicted nucleotidyltransferase